MSSAKSRKSAAKGKAAEQRRREEAERNLGFKVVWVLLNSAGLGFVAAILLLLIVRLAAYAGVEANEDVLQMWLFMVFIIFFIIAFYVLIRKHLPEHWFEDGKKKNQGPEWQAPDVKFGGVLEEKQRKYQPLFENERRAADPTALDDSDESFSGEEYVSQPLEDETEAEAPDTEGDAPDTEDADGDDTADKAPAVAKEQSEADEGSAEKPDAGAADTPDEPAEKPEPEPKEEKKEPEDEIAILAATFTATALKAIKDSKKNLDTFDRFGLNLYISGACGQLVRKGNLTVKDGLTLLNQMIIQTGSNKATADAFTQNVEEYAERERYRRMIDAGTRAMESCAFGQNGYNDNLPALLQEWSLPENRTATPKITTFMFTDIVDSTGLTEKLGNVMAQRVIRAHNTIVRRALRNQSGTEVKHTGDGIMATFPEPINAVKGAIEIQQELEAYNRKSKDLEVLVRIGLNAGEAVMEENDYFGNAVQMTARICDNAQQEEIRCSEVIFEQCPNDQDLFESKGDVELKGIGKAQKIYAVRWPRLT